MIASTADSWEQRAERSEDCEGGGGEGEVEEAVLSLVLLRLLLMMTTSGIEVLAGTAS